MIRMIKSFISFWLTNFVIVGIIISFFYVIGAPMLTTMDPYAHAPEVENAYIIIFYAVCKKFILRFI